MSDLIARPQDLADLRNALARFAERQCDTFERSEAEATRTLDALAEAITRQRYRAELLGEQAQACFREAAYAAAAGGWVDCDPLQRALNNAERRLAELIRAQDRFERAWDEYRFERARLKDHTIEHGLPRAARYLEAVLNGVEAYLEVRLDIGHETASPVPSPTQTQQYQPTLDALLTKRYLSGDVRPAHVENREKTTPEQYGRRI